MHLTIDDDRVDVRIQWKDQLLYIIFMKIKQMCVASDREKEKVK